MTAKTTTRKTTVARALRRPLTALTAAMAALIIAALAVVPTVASAQTGPGGQALQRPSGPKPTIVLVHGGWADASSWDNVIAVLQHEGNTVDAPPNPLRGLASDSAYLASYLSYHHGAHRARGPFVRGRSHQQCRLR